ncbi:site-specific tyrosine recombinase XerD [Aestuariimicrobium sp. T2.26MG-19.2B]|uniref:site-specific tyrosine recombinase XerD n=1 Tax=Aestuariimicrobium sp. T2.26MG-19.2B TaxID=3040679 RepID=UPI0024776462|nr:site-specific tyrosine recombinase XerD [Aestuariimicrobium sp. T2.26MG-19.2B]CAI9408139.1 Tyrosine recombinase XerD [Aestuariimicrobium sp. T2.26MG-19.2B]
MSAPEPLTRFVRGYLDHLRVERGLASNTLVSYRRDLDRYLEFLASRGISEPSQVTVTDVSEFARDLAAPTSGRAPLAPASVGRAVVAVRNLHAFGLADGLTPENPARDVSPPRLGTRLPKALTVDQVGRLLDSPDTDEVDGLRDAALLELLYGTGARISEVCGLDVDEVRRTLADPDHGLRLFGKGSKERLVPLGDYARRAVEAWLVRGRPQWSARARTATPALLLNTRGARLSRQSAWAVVQTHAERSGLSAEVSPHSLRHSFATHMLDGGADVRVVQELLGHASVTTTQIYTMVTVEHLREVHRAAHPRAR